MAPPPSMPWALVCPSSRGIGQAVTRRLLATTRVALLAGLDPAPAPGRLTVVRCDAADDASVRAAADVAAARFPPESHHLQLGCALPGVLHAEKAPAHIDAADALDSFRVNALAPLLLAKHFVRFLPRRSTWTARTSPGSSSSSAAVWLMMAARVGSTADNHAGGWFSYRASKAAVFSIARSLDLYLQARCGPAALAVAYHPSTVRTDFSRRYWDSVPPGSLLTPDQAADRLLGLVAGLRADQRGRCWDWRGVEVPP